MVTEQMHYEFLKANYRHDRFEGRNGNGWDRDYSACIARSSFQALESHGYTCISQHESKTGDAIWYDRNLDIATYSEMKRKYGV